ncbi:MAG: carboxypeptidase regulatory-like domain-containing protein [DPANN group archaeon]|nr:carboxypeptidase regulatory-like domain-containing protein [DPANN group archaeon]
MKKLILLLLLLNAPFVLAVNVHFTVTDAETSDPVESAVIVLNGITDPNFSETEITDSNGEATFSGVPDSSLYSYVVVHPEYESFDGVIFVDGDEDISVSLTPLGEFTWHDLFLSDGSIEISWHATDNDTIYYGGERMNHITTTTNVKTSGYIVFDQTTSVSRNTYYSNGTPTDWNSAHTPSPDERIDLKPNGGWIRTTFIGDQAEVCIGKAIIYMEGITLDLSGDEFICQTQTRNENLIPYYLNGSFYINTTSVYKVDSTHYTISGLTQNFTILNDLNGQNHPPALNDVKNKIGIEEEVITLDPIAIDPDNDPLTVSVNDSRFVFVEQQGNSFLFDWQTGEGDTGIYSVEVTVSDGEFEVSGAGNVTVLNVFDLSLKEGLNLVSFPFAHIVGDIDENPVFNDSIILQTESIESNLASVFYYEEGEWYSYNPDKPPFLNTLHTLNESQGAWFNIDSVDTLTLTGLSRYPVSFNMHIGLNLIGYPATEIRDPSVVMNGVYGTYENLLTYNASNGEWLSYNPDKPPFLNSLHEMLPGQGFWVYATQDSTWEFNGTSFNII